MYYQDLDKHDKKVVGKLAALLRLADGLDRSHQDIVQRILCHREKRRVILTLKARRISRAEDALGKEKADLFEKVFGKRIKLEWQTEERERKTAEEIIR
jgi:exopolyphosphatase/guanosine-5'-triphosphate,3'-diphosphate pyrophosphatase